MTSSLYTYIVVEDDRKASSEIIRRMNIFPEWKCLGSCTHYAEALERIRKERPHVLFLDWELGGGTSIDILQGIKDLTDYQPYLIFFTAHLTHRIPENLIHFKVHHYLDKPIWGKLDIYLKDYLRDAVLHIENHRKELFVWLTTVEKVKVKINPKELICIQQAENPRNKILCLSKTKSYEIRATWMFCEQLLKDSGVNYFVVKQREVIVNMDCIEKIEKKSALRLKDNIVVKINKDKFRELKNYI
ncbi:MAG: response regulator [Chryseobacterium sp.]|nr:response regulator [Chryseobacterium sp.]